MNVQIEPSWEAILADEFEQPYFQNIIAFLKQEIAAGKTIFPDSSNIFNAFALTPFEQVKVVLLGQDPYHGKGQAHGLCFSVQKNIKPPPSLKNIFKELEKDLGLSPPNHGCLESWAKQGMLLLNTSLTVEEGKPMSHAKIGWEQFTDAVIRKISTEKFGVIFLLWGRFAQQKEALINTTKHIVLKAAHPSPLSARAGFFGCKHFSQTNDILLRQNKSQFNWEIENINHDNL